jgi:hypothetical protein
MIIRLDGRKFLVEVDEAGIRTIREEKVHAPGRPWECLYRVSLWSRSRGDQIKRPGSLSARIQEVVINGPERQPAR